MNGRSFCKYFQISTRHDVLTEIICWFCRSSLTSFVFLLFLDIKLLRENMVDFHDTFCLLQMSFEDFECLLDLVKPLSLPVVDEMLKPFLAMDTAWYFNLWT